MLVVVGLSMAGIAAALDLAREGLRVLLVEVDDDLALRERFLVGPTKHIPAISGSEAESLGLELLRRAGVVVDSRLKFDSVAWDKDDRPIVRMRTFIGNDFVDQPAEAVVMAPNGRPSDASLLKNPLYQGILGFSLSSSAWADAPHFAHRSGVVVGDTSWAVDQSCQAAMFLNRVFLITTESSLGGPPALLDALRENRKIEVVYGSTIDRIVSSGERVQGVVVSSGTAVREIPCDVMFVAPAVIPRWDLLGGKEAAEHAASTGMIYLCGNYNIGSLDADLELETDGVRVAKVLARTKPDLSLEI